jgi:hypothetical protein
MIEKHYGHINPVKNAERILQGLPDGSRSLPFLKPPLQDASSRTRQRPAFASASPKTSWTPEVRDRIKRHRVRCAGHGLRPHVLMALDQALAVLQGSFDLAIITDQETLGIAGAIYKRRWQVTGRRDQLERSYHYYRRAECAGWRNRKPSRIGSARADDLAVLPAANLLIGAE